MQRKILSWLLASSILVAVAHYIAFSLGWYKTYLWLDIPMHFLGGVVAGLISTAIYLKVFSTLPSKKYLFLFIIVGALVIGVGWEIFEYLFVVDPVLYPNYPLDTGIDLIMDLLGANIVAFLVTKKHELKT